MRRLVRGCCDIMRQAECARRRVSSSRVTMYQMLVAQAQQAPAPVMFCLPPYIWLKAGAARCCTCSVHAAAVSTTVACN